MEKGRGYVPLPKYGSIVYKWVWSGIDSYFSVFVGIVQWLEVDPIHKISIILVRIYRSSQYRHEVEIITDIGQR